MKVLVTGGLGLVGRWVVRDLLLMGHDVRLFDTPRGGRLQRLLRHLPSGLRRRLRRMVIRAIRGSHASASDARRSLEVVRGDLCNIADVGGAVRLLVDSGGLDPPTLRAPEFGNPAGHAERAGGRFMSRQEPG